MQRLGHKEWERARFEDDKVLSWIQQAGVQAVRNYVGWSTLGFIGYGVTMYMSMVSQRDLKAASRNKNRAHCSKTSHRQS